MDEDSFNNFLKVLEFYKLKQIPRNSTNAYHDEKDDVDILRRETASEHVQCCNKLANYFIFTEREFYSLDRLRVHDLLDHHDDVEIVTRDIGIANREKRIQKEKLELEGRLVFAQELPDALSQFYLDCDAEFRAKATEEAKFANAIDKMDALVHELQYPQDWGCKGFDEKNVRSWFQPAFEYSPTFMRYFEALVIHLDTKGYFNI
ncbi:MAG: HD domain-containing protein [Nanoarchaeota archaeon]|nr:HD domain-containing protein [Nanoarchaeota archaeon]